MENKDEILKRQGFSETGIKRFKNTVNEFEKELLNKSINIGKANQEKDMPLEITSENVRDATILINKTKMKQKTHPIFILINIFEYVFMVLTTIGAANIDKDYGKLLFGICLGITVILITARLIYNNRR